MAAYENLTDSVIDRIMWSNDEQLEKSKEILKNVKKRKLYVCLGHALVQKSMVRIYKKVKGY